MGVFVRQWLRGVFQHGAFPQIADYIRNLLVSSVSSCAMTAS